MIPVHPEWGITHAPGYVGFTYTDNSLISQGIAYFERFDRYRDIPVSHTLIVSGADECIEAQASGVKRGKLSAYFDNPHTRISFRVPRGWTPELGLRIVASAASRIGDEYDYPLIVSEALAHTWLGNKLNRLLNHLPDRMVSGLCNSPHREICSELVAWALNQQPELHGLGVLSRPLDTINPQQLFEDMTLFQAWRRCSSAASPTPCIRDTTSSHD